MLAVFAVDLAKGKGAEARPELLTLSRELADAAARVLGPGEFKAGLGETVLIHTAGSDAADGLRPSGCWWWG